MITIEKLEQDLKEAETHLKLLEQDAKDSEFCFLNDYVLAHKYITGKVDCLKSLIGSCRVNQMLDEK